MQNNNPPNDIMGIVEPAFPWAETLAFLIILAVFAAMGFWLFKKFRSKYLGPKPQAVVAPAMPSEEEQWRLLRERLTELTPRDPFTKVAQAEFFFELAFLLRLAIERRTHIAVTDMTVREMEAPLRQKAPFSVDETEKMLAFLKKADQIKFAEQMVDANEAMQEKQEVQRWFSRLAPLSS